VLASECVLRLGFQPGPVGFSVQEREELAPGWLDTPRAQPTGRPAPFSPSPAPCYISSLFEVYHLPHSLLCSQKTVQRKKKKKIIPPTPWFPLGNEMSLFVRGGQQRGASGTPQPLHGAVARGLGALVHSMSQPWGTPSPLPPSHRSSPLPAPTEGHKAAK